MRAVAWRRLAVKVHLWGGLVTGPLLLVLGLSGTVLVFRGGIDGAVNGPPVVVSDGASPRSLDAVVAAALIGHPGGEARTLRLPAQPDRPYRVEVYAGDRRIDVAVDPYTLRVVASRAAERSPLVAVHSLHTALHAGRPGALLVGLLGVWLTVEAVTGLWLYGPSMRRAGGDRHRVSTRLVHRATGVISLVLGVIVGLTGAVLALGAAFAFADSARDRPASLGPGPARLDLVAERAARSFPQGRISALVAEGNGTVRVEMRVPESEGAERAGVVRVDGAGTIIEARTAPPRPDAWGVLRRLHYGDFAGWASRILYAVVGLALPVLSITGSLIWMRRRA